MSTQTEFELEVATLVVDTLNLEDVGPAEITPDEGLFDGELALDSVDALELALAISQTYGVQLKAEEEDTQKAFTTLRTLSTFIESNRSA